MADSRPKGVSVDDLYRRSTQFKLWLYTPESLEDAKLLVNEKGRGSAISRFEEARAAAYNASPEVFAEHDTELSGDKMLDLLTPEEEAKYLHYYCQSIITTANHFNMPTQVKATAASFFRKFYLVNSVMEYHPKNVLYTTLFLAAKSENYFISIESFCKAIPKTEPAAILDLEFIVLLSLQFTLLVHHPFRPLYGFFLDFQTTLLHPSPVMYDVNVDTIGALYDKAKTWLLEHALLSDVCFLFTPPQIALAAMYDLDKRITDRYLKKKYLDVHTLQEALPSIKEEEKPHIEQENGQSREEEKVPEEPQKASLRDQYETLVRTIRKCIKVAKQVPETSREESAVTDRKCFFALNPEKALKKRIKQLRA